MSGKRNKRSKKEGRGKARREARTRAREAAGPRGFGGFLHEPAVQLILYSLLLVGTPFIMLRAYMQDAIGRFSATTFPVAGLEVPLVLVIAVTFVAGAVALLRPRITRRGLLAAAVGLTMVGFAQQVTDYYFGHRFYELQFNWHYIAYTIFSFLAYRYLRRQGHSLARCLLVTAAAAAIFSAFDEGFQLVVNTRIFDMGDIAKDLWGATTGMTMLLVGTHHAELADGQWRRVRHPRLRDYFRHAPSVWLLLVVTSFSFMSYASVLTEPSHIATILGLTAATVLAFFVALHLSQHRWPRRLLAAAALAAVLALGTSYALHRNEHVHVHRWGLTVYKGIPIPLFDVLFYPGGGFRLVDKKHYFNGRDQAFFLRNFQADLIVIGAGYEGNGGAGYPHKRGSGFVFNRYTGRGTQVIILESAAACAYYNEQKARGRDVLFILHTTC